MLADERLDIVSVATYAPAHAPMVLACARHGVRAVYCEKPMATRLADGEAMLRACAEAGALLVVNHNRRFNPNYRRLQALIRDGGLGELTSISLRWGTGRLGNVGTHLIDTARMLTGREVQAVSATLDLSGRPDCRGPAFQDPGGWGVLRFEGGLMATVDAADHGAGPLHAILYGTAGRALAGREDVTLELWDGRTEHWPSTRAEATAMDRAIAEIVAWLDDGGSFSSPAEGALRTLEVIVAFHASHARNAAWTELPLTGADREREVRCA
jgi:predicted dehydrogenase